jgi:hypothetical protein
MIGKLRLIDGMLVFWCPACKLEHALTTKHFDFNGDWAAPTISPDITVANHEDMVPVHCHSFVRKGYIEYLDDCTHVLAGTTVPMRTFGVH